MYKIDEKQYIFNQSNGKILNIYYKENTGLCMSLLSGKKNWMAPELITRNVLRGFSACMDDVDKIHIICNDKDGNILYITNKSDVWKTETILHSKKANAQDKFLNIMCTDYGILFFYILEYSGSPLLSFQILRDRGGLTDPKVIDYVTVTGTPYKVLKDKNGLIYILYKGYENTGELGYRTFINSSLQWSECIKIKSHIFGPETRLLDADIDSQDNFHIFWQVMANNRYELIHSYQLADNDVWTEEKILDSASILYDNFSLLTMRKSLIACWTKNLSLYYCTSNNNGQAWSKPTKYNTEVRNIYCFDYYSNLPLDPNGKSLKTIPGSFSEGFKLLFENNVNEDTNSNSESSSFNTIQLDNIASDIEKIKQQLEEIKLFLIKLEDQIEGVCDRRPALKEPSFFSSQTSFVEDGLKRMLSKSVPLKADDQSKSQEIPNPFAQFYNQKSLADTPKATTEASISEKPIMPGLGFSHITPQFLENMKK